MFLWLEPSDPTNITSSVLQEFLISAFEERIIQEIELRIMRITYRELVTEDRELIVTAAEGEAQQPAFDTPVKSYRIMEGMGVTFHCRMSGKPLPKVLMLKKNIQFKFLSVYIPMHPGHSCPRLALCVHLDLLRFPLRHFTSSPQGFFSSKLAEDRA